MALSTGLARLLLPYLAPSNLIMVYLLGVVVVAASYGRGPAVVASLASVAAFDFFCVPPQLSFAVSDLQYVVVFAVMLVVALVIAGLTARLRQQALAAEAREQRTAALSEVSRALANQARIGDSLAMAMSYVGQLFDGQAVVLLPDAAGELAPHGEEKAPPALGPAERGIARWAYERGEMAGWDTDRLSQASALYMPLVGSGPALGVIALIPQQHGSAARAGRVRPAADPGQPDRAGTGTGAANGEGSASAGPDRNGAPARFAPQRHLPRPAHPAGGHHRLHLQPDRDRRGARPGHPPGAAGIGL